LLRRPGERPAPRTVVGRWAARLQHGFNARFERTIAAYRLGVARVIERRRLFMLGYAALCAVLVLVFMILPTSFLPTEDEGSAIVQYTHPSGATQNRSLKVAQQVEDYFLETEKKNVDTIFTVTGFGFGGSGQNSGLAFMALAPWDERPGSENGVIAITQRASRALAGVRDARVFALTPPPVRGLGQSSGFTLELLNSENLSHEEFTARRDQLLAEAGRDPELAAVRPSGLEDTPNLHIEIDEAKAGALGISQDDVYQTLSMAWGSVYVNDFVDRGRVKRVYLQGDAPFRSAPLDLEHWFVRSASGQMAPFSAFARTTWTNAPAVLSRFNGLSAYEIQGQAAPGKSSGDAMNRIAQLAAKLPGTSIAWSGLSYQERLAGGQGPLLYGLSLLVVFLCLAALYESWSVPLGVLLVIPIGLLGAVLAVFARGLQNDVFCQVGLLTTMGLSAKNAILIVEFAEQAERQGKDAYDAALEAAQLRLRPILMTSFAFIFGVLPLALSTGAGARSRVAIGTSVLGGMLAATALAIFYVPMFFVLLRRIFRRRARPEEHWVGGTSPSHAE
jgi:multidrug efflux pump